MTEKTDIPLMTKYLLKKILSKYRHQLNHPQIDCDLSENSNDIDINKIILSLNPDPLQIHIFIKQLETLTSMHQVYDKQGFHQETENIESKIIHILGYKLTDNSH